MSSITKATKRKRVPKCSNCLVENPTHNYQNCKEPCNICNKSDHKTRSCPYYRIKNRNKRHMPNPNPNNNEEDTATTSNTLKNNNDSDSGNRELRETENVLAENGVFALAAMTSAATLPSNFKSIEVQKYQIKFKTVNGFTGTINLHTDENVVRNVREEFQKVHVNYVNRNRSTPEDGIEYSIKLNEKNEKSAPSGGREKIRKVGKFLSQAKFYKSVMPAKIPLRQTDIPPADWRVEKYVLWERQKNAILDEIEFQEEDQSGTFTGSIFDEPPDVYAVVRNWKKGKSTQAAYYHNPPQVPELDQDDQGLLSDYIEYLSEGLRLIQYHNEINRRSELRYCSYLDKAVEMYRQHITNESSHIISTFFSESQDNRDRAYLIKKKMVGKRLNKIITKCQLNWQIIDCVEELSVNFLTNTVQEESLNILINEINEEYAPKFLTKRSENNKIHELLEKARFCLNGIKSLDLNAIDAEIKTLKETNQLNEMLDLLQTKYYELEYDLVKDEDEREFLDLNEKEEEEFNNIMEERREFLSRLEIIIENTKNKS
jgi:hypothetical protein